MRFILDNICKAQTLSRHEDMKFFRLFVFFCYFNLMFVVFYIDCIIVSLCDEGDNSIVVSLSTFCNKQN